MLRVLVIDDRRENLELASYLLRAHGAEVVATSDGRRAVHLARSFEPDLILVDLHMPGVDGLTVLRALAADAGTKGLPVAMFSATATSAELAVLAKDRGLPRVRKAVDPEVFLDDVRVVLAGAGKELGGPVRRTS